MFIVVFLAEAYVGMQFGCKQGGNAGVKLKLLICILSAYIIGII